MVDELSLSGVMLPTAPSDATEATTKAYVDGGLAGKVDTTARGPQGGLTVLTYAASLSITAANGNSFAVSATGNITAIAFAAAGVDGQRVLLEVFASGATRTVTTTLPNATGVTLPLSIPTGDTGYLGFYYSARRSSWVLIAAQAEV